jgi:zinc transporter ZupT
MAAALRRLLALSALGNEECNDACRKTLREGKIALAFAVFILTFGASLAPWGLQKCFARRSLDMLSVTSALSAGIILGAFLSHLLPDAQEAFEDYFAAAMPDAADSKIAT